MSSTLRLARALVASLLIALVTGCGSSDPSTEGGSESTTVDSSSEGEQSITTPAVTDSASTTSAEAATIEPTPMAIAPGEEWIVYQAPLYERDHDVGNRLVRPDGSDDHWATPQVPIPRDGRQVTRIGAPTARVSPSLQTIRCTRENRPMCLAAIFGSRNPMAPRPRDSSTVTY
jgi:hypothetical protein